MSDEPGAIAKAFLDALPSLDFKKLVDEARRSLSIVVIGDPEVADSVVECLRAGGTVPEDSRLHIWRHVQGESAPKDSGKPELVIAIPATAEHLAIARTAFSGVSLIPVILKDVSCPEDLVRPISMSRVDVASVRGALVPRVTSALWERRLALGRGLPATRRHVARRLTQATTRDPRVLLGSVAGAGAGRSGAPTAATAQLLVHQAALIAAIAAISGAPLDDKVAMFKRAGSMLLPTLLLDGAEAGLSKLATGGSEKHGKLYGQLAAYVARPALSASSTLLAGTLASLRFHERDASPREAEASHSVFRNTRSAGKRVVYGAGQGAAVALTAVGGRLRLPGRARPSADADDAAGTQPARDDAAAGQDDVAGAGER